jgi:hypothetical protein
MIPLFQCVFAIGMLLIKSSERTPIINVHVQINEKVTILVTFCKENILYLKWQCLRPGLSATSLPVGRQVRPCLCHRTSGLEFIPIKTSGLLSLLHFPTQQQHTLYRPHLLPCKPKPAQRVSLPRPRVKEKCLGSKTPR